MSFLYRLMDKSTNTVSMNEFVDYSYFSGLENVVEKLRNDNIVETEELNVATIPHPEVGIYQQDELIMKRQYENSHIGLVNPMELMLSGSHQPNPVNRIDWHSYHQNSPTHPVVKTQEVNYYKNTYEKNVNALQSLEIDLFTQGLVFKELFPGDPVCLQTLRTLLQLVLTDQLTYSAMKAIEVYQAPYSVVPTENKVLFVVVCDKNFFNATKTILLDAVGKKMPIILKNTMNDLSEDLGRKYRKIWDVEFNVDLNSNQKLFLFDDLATEAKRIVVSAKSIFNDILFSNTNNITSQTLLPANSTEYSIVLSVPKTKAYGGVTIGDIYISNTNKDLMANYGITVTFMNEKSSSDIENDYYEFKMVATLTEDLVLTFATLDYAEAARIYTLESYSTTVLNSNYTKVRVICNICFNEQINLYDISKIKMYQYDSSTETRGKEITDQLLTLAMVPVAATIDNKISQIYTVQVIFEKEVLEGFDIEFVFDRASVYITDKVGTNMLKYILNPIPIQYIADVINAKEQQASAPIPVINSTMFTLKEEE